MNCLEKQVNSSDMNCVFHSNYLFFLRYIWGGLLVVAGIYLNIYSKKKKGSASILVSLQQMYIQLQQHFAPKISSIHKGDRKLLEVWRPGLCAKHLCNEDFLHLLSEHFLFVCFPRQRIGNRIVKKRIQMKKYKTLGHGYFRTITVYLVVWNYCFLIYMFFISSIDIDL